ncbi:DUF2461 domain-containing protein [Sulfurimonas sp. MAG313]|nr:DUF2461 domain-containing protein [Sulfurimonas sp. MAG313]MDF1880637.1 DUF2461 domain-containing protein [Sulfurimonas sp. MAG313]
MDINVKMGVKKKISSQQSIAPCFTGYSKRSLDFLKELRANNSKEWFEERKYIYEEYILEANRSFVIEMGEHIQALVPTINSIPKINGSMYRIYRDTRFAKDKTPMKTHTGVIFWQGEAKRTQSANFYTRATPEEYVIGAGIRRFDTALLSTYRNYILDLEHADKLFDILQTCKKKGFDIIEPSYKRLPRGFSKTYPYPELALLNGMVVNKKFTPDTIYFSHKLIDRCYSIYEELFELQQWLYEMTLTKINEE